MSDFLAILALWILGFALHIGGSSIHVLLVLAVVVLVHSLLTRSRRRAL